MCARDASAYGRRHCGDVAAVWCYATRVHVRRLRVRSQCRTDDEVIIFDSTVVEVNSGTITKAL